MVIRVAQVLFAIWAAIIALNWIMSNPESAPQQAALAGQTLVLLFIPYSVLAVFQRSAGSKAD